MKKKILSMVLTLCMVLSLMPAFSIPSSAASTYNTMTAVYNNGNYGTTLSNGDTVTISSADELKYLATYTNAAKTTTGVTFKLTQDINLNNQEWTPIGKKSSSPFKGTFDGSGHSISELYISTAEAFHGLFGISSGTIQNVAVKGSIKGNIKMGGVVGYNTGTVRNCRNECTITGIAPATGGNSTNNIGGVVGNNGGGKVQSCRNEGAVSGSTYLGGIVGKSDGGEITNCSNIADISGGYEFGGIVGYVYDGKFENCYNTGSVMGTLYYVGGIVGKILGTPTFANCYNTGAVNAAEYNVGGIASSSKDGTFLNCYYLENCATVGTVAQTGLGGEVLDVPGQTDKMSADAMKATTFVNTLNNNAVNITGARTWKKDVLNENGGYPLFEPSAVPPTINSITVAKLIYGYTSGGISVSATAATGHTLSYQWYSNASNSNQGGSKISGATSNTYTIPTGKGVGDYYFYCEITSTRNDNNQTATDISGVATVTISPKSSQAAPSGLEIVHATAIGGTGQIKNTSAMMEYTTNTSADVWTSCTQTGTSVMAGTYYVRYKETNDKNTGVPTAAMIVMQPSVTPSSAPSLSSKTDTSVTLISTSGYEYSKDATNWVGSNVFSGLNVNTKCTFYQRVAASGTSLASDASPALTVTTKNSASPTPTAKISSVTSNSITITAVTGGEYSLDGGSTWTDSNKFTGLTAATKYTFAARIKGTESTVASATSKPVEQYTAATTPLAREGYTINYSSETISITSGYEVSTDIFFANDKLLANGTAITPGTTYYVRKAVNTVTTPNTPASAAANFTVASKPNAPAASVVSINYTAETITFDNAYEVNTKSDFTGTAVTSGSSITAYISSNGTVAQTLYVRVKAVSDGAPASLCTPVTIPARPAMTGLSITTSKTATTITVTKITGAEYSKDGGKTWQSSNEFTSLTENTNYSITIRYAATTKAFASAALASVTVKTKISAATAPSVPTIKSQMCGSITIEIVEGNQYVITTTNTEPTTWDTSETTDGEKNFSSLIAATQYYIWVRQAETETAMPSYVNSIIAYTAAVAPLASVVSINYTAEAITFDSAYEVNTKSDFTGTAVTSGSITGYISDKGTEPQTLYVRVKAITSGAPASLCTPVTIPARPEAAGLSITTSKTDTTITVTAIAGAEYSKDGGKTWQKSNKFTGITANTDYNITIHYAATDKTFASAALASVTVKTKVSAATAPSSPSIKSQTCNSITIEAVQGNQYVITTTNTEPTTWDATETTAGEKTFSSLTAATQYYIWVRQAETETAMTSKASSASAYTAAATPAASVVSINYTAETITFDNAYEVNTKSDFTGTAVTSGSSITAYISSNGTGSQNFYVRVKAVSGGAPASLCAAVTIPERPQTPVTGGSNETVDNKNDGKITGMTTAMEWSVAGGTYAAVTAEQASSGITGLSDGTYNVRIKAIGGTGFKSVEQEISIASGHTITVAFDSKGGSNVASIKDKACGDSIAAPADPTRKGFYFAGWYKEATYDNVWTFALDKLTDNMTLFAKWSAIPTYTVTGKAVDDSSSAVEGATVKIMQGTVQFGTTGATNTNGDFEICNVPSGTYNLVITKGARSAVIKVEVSSSNVAIGNVTLPSGNANSVLVIKGADTPDVVIGGLNTEANTQLSGNTSVEMTLTVEKKDAKTAEHGSNVSSSVTSAGQQVGIILEINLSKSVDGGSSAPVLEALNLIEVIIPIPAELQSKSTYAVYRYHGTGVDAITETENTDHEKIVINRANHTITLYTKKFSTYAIGYTNPIYIDNSKENYTITASAGEGGSISPSGSASVTGGESKTFAITANKGYKISDVKVDGESVGAVGSYTFSNVISTHTIAATFERTKATALPYFVANGKDVFIGFSTDKSGTMNYIAPKGATVLYKENAKSFTDIAGHWAKNNMDFVTERELFLGTGESEFSPLSGMTRAMFATVIGRLYERSYGELAAKNGHAFTDVNYDDYYGAYIDWAAENNIITGVGGGLFEPEREITRQEMASILYRFAKLLKALPNGVADVALAYPDSADIEIWASEAAQYCQKTGIITGRDGGNFVPQGTATRDEVAAILQRFIENTVK